MESGLEEMRKGPGKALRQPGQGRRFQTGNPGATPPTATSKGSRAFRAPRMSFSPASASAAATSPSVRASAPLTVSSKNLVKLEAPKPGGAPSSFKADSKSRRWGDYEEETGNGSASKRARTSYEAPLGNLSDVSELRVAEESQACPGNGISTGANVSIDDENFAMKSSRGFQTAAGKKVDVSEEALKRAKALFENCEFEASQSLPSFKGSGSLKDLASGFSAAAGKGAALSEEGLGKADATIWSEKVLGLAGPLIPPQDAATCHKVGFQTAAGKKVDISESALKKARALFEDCEALASQSSSITKSSSALHDAAISFSKAGEKIISAGGRRTPKTMFGDQEELSLPARATTGGKVGFQTAAGKKVDVSEQALKRARAMFEDCESKASQSSSSTKGSSVLIDAVNTFSKAEEPGIAEDTLRTQRTMISCEEELSLPARATPGGKVGFQTAGGKKVDISEQALKRARAMFEDCETKASQSSALTKSSNVFNGAVTNFSKTEEGIAEDTLRTPRTMFSGEGELSLPAQVTTNSKVGFQTAAGKKVDVSEQALEQARAMFEDCETKALQSSPATKGSFISGDSVKGFATAGGKRVTLSEEALKRAKALFSQDLDCDKAGKNYMQGGNNGAAGTSRGPAGDGTNDRMAATIDDEEDFDWDTQMLREIEDQSAGPKGLTVADTEVNRKRRLERQRQEIAIAAKKLQPVRPCPGSLFVRKHVSKDREAIMRLESLGSRGTDSTCSGTPFAFNVGDSLIALEGVGDGCNVVPDDLGRVGTSELERAFLASPGVDPGLLPKGWFANHYRWVVWGLASLEQRFRHVLGQCLDPHQVLLRMKLRYDRDIDREEKSALKGIYQGDLTPSGHGLVLCIAAIVQTLGGCEAAEANEEAASGLKRQEGDTLLELTDGWYQMPAVVPASDPLAKHVRSGKLAVGTKVISFASEVVNLSTSSFCHPLEVPSFADILRGDCASLTVPYLKLKANSCRVARWDTKLGFYYRAASMPTSLSSVVPDGGLVSEVVVQVVRKYPLLYKETVSGTSVGVPGFLGEKEAEQKIRAANVDEQSVLEEVLDEVRKEFECRELAKAKAAAKKAKPRRRTAATEKFIRSLIEGKEIMEALQDSHDPDSLESLLTEVQREALLDYKKQCEAKLSEEIKAEVKKRVQGLYSSGEDPKKAPSQFTPVLKIRVLDLAKPNGKDDGAAATKTTAILSVWKPPEGLYESLSEGRCFRIYNLVPGFLSSSGKDCAISLRSLRNTRFEPLPQQLGCALLPQQWRRRTWSIMDLVEENRPGSEVEPPVFQEVDLIGVVVRVDEDSPGMSPQPSRHLAAAGGSVVYLCDTMMNFAAVLFRKSLAESGYGRLIRQQKLMTDSVGDNIVLCFRNLTWTGGGASAEVAASTPGTREAPASLPCLTATEFTQISSQPKDLDDAATVRDIRSDVGEGINLKKFVAQARSRLAKLQSSSTGRRDSWRRHSFGGTSCWTPVATPSSTSPFGFQPSTCQGNQTSSVLQKDPVMAASPLQIVENSPAAVQSARNRQRLRLLERYSASPLSTLPPLPAALADPRLSSRWGNRLQGSRLTSPFRTPVQRRSTAALDDGDDERVQQASDVNVVRAAQL